MGENYVLPIEQTRVTRQQAKVQQIIEETDAKAQEIIQNAQNQSQIVVQAANTEADTIIENARRKGESEYEAIKNNNYLPTNWQAGTSGTTILDKDGNNITSTISSTNP